MIRNIEAVAGLVVCSVSSVEVTATAWYVLCVSTMLRKATHAMSTLSGSNSAPGRSAAATARPGGTVRTARARRGGTERDHLKDLIATSLRLERDKRVAPCPTHYRVA